MKVKHVTLFQHRVIDGGFELSLRFIGDDDQPHCASTMAGASRPPTTMQYAAAFREMARTMELQWPSNTEKTDG